MTNITNIDEQFDGMLYPTNGGYPLITSEYILGGCHTFTSRTDLNVFLSYEKHSIQEVGTFIHLKTDEEDKYYSLKRIAYYDDLTWDYIPAEIEEVKFSDSTSAYTYSSHTISNVGEVVYDETKTFSGNSKDAIEHLLTQVDELKKQLELANNKATLYDASTTDAIKVTFDAPYSNPQRQESMSGYTGLHMDTAYIDLGDIDDIPTNENS